jgi:hypothetical protein
MTHYIVTQFFFQSGDPVKINIILMCCQLLDLDVGNGQSEIFLALGERKPQFAPGGVFVLGRPDETHLFTGIAVGQRITVRIIHNKNLIKIYG